MPRPQFTRDEEYLIHSAQSAIPNRMMGAFMWGYLVPGLVIAGFSAWYGSIPMMLAAFVVLCGFRIYEDRLQASYEPLWRSILDKYEQALIESAPVADRELERT